MAEVLKKFARYFLLDQLAQGGMAEIYRARLATVDGAGRLIVIKKIQAGFGANTEFLQMFRSEIKVTMGFNHPNIVQLYDFGDEDNQPYIAMELVDGKNVKQFMARFNELKQSFPIELAVYITEQVASGLHYAHSFKDKISGTPLSIVHRDISPHNILISYEGNVKIIDFGIAKATTNSESTRAGVIKGKPSYLSPEQISGEVLDGRSDIFALGIVLWELLAGKKLFAGENDLAVLKLIESCQTHVKPPSTFNPKVTKELDYIVLKALSKQRDKRYQSAEELQRALHKFLYSFAPDFNPSDLAYYAKDLFKNEIVEDRKKIQKLNDKIERLLSDNTISRPTNTVAQEGSDDDTTTLVEAKSRTASSGNREVFKAQVEQVKKVEIEALPPTAPRTLSPGASRGGSSSIASSQVGLARPRTNGTATSAAERSGGKNLRLALLGIIALAFIGPIFGLRVPILSDLISDWTSGSEARLVLKGDDKSATVAVNGATVAHGLPATLSNIPVGTPFHVSVLGPNGAFQQDVTLKKGEKKEIFVAFSNTTLGGNPTNSSATTSGSGNGQGIQLKLNINPAGGNLTVNINGKPVDAETLTAQVPVDEPLDISVERSGYKPFRREFVLESRQIQGLKEWSTDVQLEPLNFGYLTIHTTPSATATTNIAGSPWVKKTPIENEKVPIGEYNIRLNNEVLGMEKTIRVTIQEGKAVTIDERLEIKN